MKCRVTYGARRWNLENDNTQEWLLNECFPQKEIQS